MTRRVVQDVTVHAEEPVQGNTSEDYSVLDSVPGTAPEPRQAPDWDLITEVQLCGCTRDRECPQHRQARTGRRRPLIGW